jgi:hypothetical protein
LGASGPLAPQNGQLVAERYDLELQFYATAKPTAEPREEFREERLHAGDTTADRTESPDFSRNSEFLVGTGSSNAQIGLYIGCAPTGGISAGCTAAKGSANVIDIGEYSSNTETGIAVDSGDLANQVGLNNIGFGAENGISDAVDANTSCGTNLWFNDQIGTTPAQACIK